MLALTHASLATVDQLFRYKKQQFTLELFPGYTPDQWGVKAHNRPWIVEAGKFLVGQKIIEVGGAYSLLPKYLHDEYGCEAWIGDDFGMKEGDKLWSRWGNPHHLPKKYPQVKYIFENFGSYSEKFPDSYFDCIFSVSTLEHIAKNKRIDVFKDMNRCLRPGGKQLHTIDVSTNLDYILGCLNNKDTEQKLSEIESWIDVIKESGVSVNTSIPNTLSLLDRKILVESPDVVYRFYPPNNCPKAYNPNASLLLVIENISDPILEKTTLF
ncbi:class I SAM-dependent methyltransferase [Geitlerinema sp. P-1104]|uniref:class I SAM-dependent methyltransferase n=1 Tax=Geitlerinema sp. P-1104 TaxID=2546230 RepID=UPI00147760FB|nr:class I SAM-dependent methyltransferase [Geitlerinema sp. P-1104]NMG59558.1 class I SAM-dependent methyltransferase [Geitlerinema sp. P-1104]